MRLPSLFRVNRPVSPMDPDGLWLAGYRQGRADERAAQAGVGAVMVEVTPEDPEWPDAARWAPGRAA